jgi:hypothetical protein
MPNKCGDIFMLPFDALKIKAARHNPWFKPSIQHIRKPTSNFLPFFMFFCHLSFKYKDVRNLTLKI